METIKNYKKNMFFSMKTMKTRKNLFVCLKNTFTELRDCTMMLAKAFARFSVRNPTVSTHNSNNWNKLYLAVLQASDPQKGPLVSFFV